MPLKVIHIYKTFFPETQGGVEQYIYNACKSLEAHNIESKILCTSKINKKRTSYLYNGIEVITYPETLHAFSCPVSIQYFFNFYKEIEWADIIHYHYPWPFADILPLLFSIKKPQIATYHSDIVKQKLLKYVLQFIDKAFLKKMDKIIATSVQYKETSENLILFSDKVEIIPICLDQNIYPTPQITECKKIHKKFGSKFLLFVGQLRYYKGLPLLIKAMQDINSNLVIIGKGPLEKQLHTIVKTNNIKNIHFVGSLDEQAKVNYLSSCYTVILPSHLRSEAFGISLLEGCMFGKPLISCKIGTGTEYVNNNNDNGLVVQPNSVAIHNAITTLLNNPTLAETMGKNSLKRFESHFSIGLLGNKLSSLIKALVIKK